MRLGSTHQARRWLTDLYALHQLVMSGFPDDCAPDARRRFAVLFRLEEDRRQVLVQSAIEPRWLVSSLDVEIDGPKPLEPLLDRVKEGEIWRFRLRANPTRRVARTATFGPDPDRGRLRPERPESVGRRVAIRSDGERLEWLARVGRAKGFELVSSGGAALGTLNVRVRNVGSLSIRAPGRSAPITIEVAEFEGFLRVRHRDLFTTALRDGIGPGKAFGCGLLSIAPL
jgi:CRISPR system Cascade subunit CasE